MRTAFYFDATAIVASLLLAWTGLSHLPPTSWLVTRASPQQWSLFYGLLVVAAAGLAAWRWPLAVRRPLRLPPIPGVKARTCGWVALGLAVLSSLTLYWWLAAGARALPTVGAVGFWIGTIAIGAVTWGLVAAGALWLGDNALRELEHEEAASSAETTIGLG
ncbi:MAG: hypothetical protein MUC69_01725 [Gemmatimonadales bacterium]|nr:hypothetical protein [Gemmatimonadales bacterium]